MQTSLVKEDLNSIEKGFLPQMSGRMVYALSFLLPFISMIVIYAVFGIYPFGDRTVLVMDMDGQYADFFAYYHKVLTGEGSLFYSFGKQMGGNVFGLFTYYLSSPFFLLAAFFPNAIMPEGIALITVLKIATCGLTFAIFIKNLLKKSDLAVVLFSCAYALMTYNMHYQMCIMWLDGAIWLPIILLGTERIIYGKSGGLFLASYTLSLFSNYYTAYMNTLFVVLYFFSRYFIVCEQFDLKDFIKKIIRILLLGLVGVALGAVVLYPTFLDILNGKMATGSYVADGFLNKDITKIARRLFIGQYDSITNTGNPNIFCGMLCGLMTGVFFFNPKISTRRKALTGAVYAVLLISFFVKRVDMAWHIFQYPNWFPYRYAYAFCLLCLMTAAIGFYEMEKAPKVSLVYGSGAYLALLAAAWMLFEDVLTNETFAMLSIVLAVVYIVAFFVFINTRKNIKTLICALLVIVTCAELSVNGIAMLEGLNGLHKYKSRSEYGQKVSDIGEAVDYVKEIDDSFYRMEKTFIRTYNDGLAFGYNGTSHYSSTYNNQIVKLIRELGIIQEYVVTTYTGSTVITDSLLGVKYVISEDDVCDDYEKIKEFDKYSIYKNPYALGIGFAVSEYALATPSNTSSYLENQDTLATALLGNSYRERVENLSNTDADTIAFTAPKDGLYYLSLGKKYLGDVELTVNGEKVEYPYDKAEKKIFCLGDFVQGTEVSVRFLRNIDNPEVSCFDTARFYADCLVKNEKSSFEVDEYSNTRIKGKVNIKDGEVLLTTIPYEKGWTAYVDGKKCEILSAQDVFMAVNVPSGEHEVELKYTLPGFLPSLCISFATLAGICVFGLLKRKKKQKNA